MLERHLKDKLVYYSLQQRHHNTPMSARLLEKQIGESFMDIACSAYTNLLHATCLQQSDKDDIICSTGELL